MDAPSREDGRERLVRTFAAPVAGTLPRYPFYRQVVNLPQ
jgi:hypothetical protein